LQTYKDKVELEILDEVPASEESSSSKRFLEQLIAGSKIQELYDQANPSKLGELAYAIIQYNADPNNQNKIQVTNPALQALISLQPPVSGGAKYRKTGIKKPVGKREMCIWKLGRREYVCVKGKFMTLKAARDLYAKKFNKQ
jgi:hypothetical protein